MDNAKKQSAVFFTALLFMFFFLPSTVYADTFNITSVSTETDAYLQSFIIISIMLLFVVVANVTQIYLFFIAGGVWLLGNAVSLYVNMKAFTGSFIFYSILAIYLIYLGVFFAIKKKEISKLPKNYEAD